MSLFRRDHRKASDHPDELPITDEILIKFPLKMRQSFICINPKLTFHFFTKKIYLNFKENKKKLLNVMIFVCYWISPTKTLCIIFVSLIICTIADSSLYRIMKMSKYWSKMFIDQQINNNTWWCIQFSIRTTVSGLVRDTNSIYSKPCGCASERRWLFYEEIKTGLHTVVFTWKWSSFAILWFKRFVW